MEDSNSPVIREMRLEDCEEVVALEQSLEATSWGLDLFRGEFGMDPSQRSWIVAEVGGVIAGFAGISHVVGEANILNIGVAKQHQRQGLGSVLVTRLLDIASSGGCEKLWLEVETTNLSAISLYEKFGFEPANIRNNYYGKGRDAQVMSCNPA